MPFPALSERLELEKQRSRQSLEDLEQLRAKEVPPLFCHLASQGLQMPQCGPVAPKRNPGRAPCTHLGVLGGSPPARAPDQALEGTLTAWGRGTHCHALCGAAPWKELDP